MDQTFPVFKEYEQEVRAKKLKILEKLVEDRIIELVNLPQTVDGLRSAIKWKADFKQDFSAYLEFGPVQIAFNDFPKKYERLLDAAKPDFIAQQKALPTDREGLQRSVKMLDEIFPTLQDEEVLLYKEYRAAVLSQVSTVVKALARLEQDITMNVFSTEEFQRPDIMEALYYGDFSEINDQGRTVIYYASRYLDEFNKAFNIRSDIQDYPAPLRQIASSCAKLYDPSIEVFMTENILLRNNLLGDTKTEQLNNIGARVLDFLNRARTDPIDAMSVITEPALSLNAAIEMGGQDALILFRKHRCDSEITKQIYSNIKPFLRGQKGSTPIINTRIAKDLTEGCRAQRKGNNYCQCMAGSVLRSKVPSDDQELLAANFFEGAHRTHETKISPF